MKHTTDVERLQTWIATRDITLYALAKEVDVPYNTLWRMVNRNDISDRFLRKFIQRYGCDEAVSVFIEHLTQSTSKPS